MLNSSTPPNTDDPTAQSQRKTKRVVYTRKTTRYNPPPIADPADPAAIPPATPDLSPLDMDKRILAHVLLKQLSMINHPDGKNAANAQRYIADFRHRFTPHDPVEELLFGQMLITHTRVLQLSHLSSDCKDIFDATQLNTQTDRAISTFHKHMRLFMDYRYPAMCAQKHPKNPKRKRIAP